MQRLSAKVTDPYIFFLPGSLTSSANTEITLSGRQSSGPGEDRTPGDNRISLRQVRTYAEHQDNA